MLSAAIPGSLSLEWNDDPYGNRLGQSASGNWPVTIAQTSISVTPQNGVLGPQYDLAGNVKNSAGGDSYTYDAENRLVGTGNWAYAYDALGRRVAKSQSGTLTAQYLYDGSGNRQYEWNGLGTVVHQNAFAGSKLWATYSGGHVYYQYTDWLGTKRAEADETGAVQATFSSLPFGDSLAQTGSGVDATEHHLTGKERDAESGLDYFGARYNSSNMGRFMSPDPMAGNISNPQSLNRYAYVLNNPLTNTDPNGLDCIYATDNGKGVESIDHDSDSGECGQNGGTWLSGYVDEGWAHYNKKAKAFEAASEDGGQVNFAQFQAGAQTNECGDCLSGCGSYGFASAGADWLTGQLRGNSVPTDGSDPLDGLLTFMTGRDKSVNKFWQFVAGPLNPSDDHWAGPNGMGPPGGTGDWRAAVHDYNFSTNGITIQNTGYYFSPFLSPATTKALIQSNEQLMKTGGFQGAKEKFAFGIVNAYQWYMGSWK